MLQEHIEKLLSTNYNLIALETSSPEKSVNGFRPLVREGKAVYVWENDIGLLRMETSHITIPNTKTPEMVINHIVQSKLYGVYLLVGFSKAINQASLAHMLKQFAADKTHDKVIIFIDSHFNYPQNLMSDILITQEADYKDTLNQIA